MANADFTRIAVVKETTFATAVATPTMLTVNVTEADLRMATGKVQSRIIRSDAQMIRGTKVSESAGTRIAGELQYDASGGFFELLKASMRSAAETAATTTVTSATSSTTHILGTGVHTGVEVGDIIRVRTSADALVAYAAVTAVATDDLTTSHTFGTLSGLKVRRGIRIKNATTAATFNVNETHAEAELATPMYEVFFGMMPTRFTTNVQIDQPTTWGFDFMGSHSDKITDADIAGSSYTPAPTTAVVKSTLPKVYIDGQSFCVTQLSCGWDLNAAVRRCLDTQRARSIRTGKFGASGQAQIYFENKTLYQTAINDTESNMFYVQDDTATIATDSGGNAIAFAFPNVQWGEATHPVTGENSDVFLNLPWTAAVDSVEGITARVIFFPAAN